MKKIFFKTLLILFVLQGPAGAQAQPNPAGIYSISRGVSANNSEYTGKVKVEDRGGGVYYLYWKVPNAEETRGIGLLDHSTLAIAYSSVPDYGLVIYKVDGGKLSGEWFNTKTEWEFGYEDLEGPAGLNGTYQIVDAQLDDSGDKYSGTVEIRPTGEVYQLTWYVGDDVLTGVGLLKGDYLIAGWGTEAGVGYYEIKDNELLGTWAAAGANRAGVENLVRVSPARNGVASTMKIEELTQNIEKAISQINTLSHDYVLRYRPKGADITKNIDLIKSTSWYTKPGSARTESLTLYLPQPEPRKNVYIGKLEGASYNTYEILDDGSVKKTSYPAEEWGASGYTPDYIYNKMKQRIKDGIPCSLEYQKDRNVYVLTFNAPDQAAFEISGESWLPYLVSSFDSKQDVIVQVVWSNIQINPELSDELFRLPDEMEKK